MPWGPEDAPKHTKLAKSSKQRRQWAHVANAMLKKTKSEAKAIKAANAAVSGDALDDLGLDDAMLESLDEGRRKRTKRDPRGRVISTEEDDGVDVSITGDVAPDNLQMFDAVELDDAAKARVTSDGYLVANPRVARIGIQVYAGRECGVPEMDEVRVYRPETSVFDAAAVHTYTHLPVTLGHPKVLVNSKNWKDHAVGDTGDEVLRDGGTVRIPMMVRDEAAVRAIRDGKDQLSVGYTCDLDWTAGMTDDGEQYDAVQTNIRANHLAIVAAARGGSTLRVGDDQQHMEDNIMQLKNVTVDGIECQMTDTAASIVQRTIQRLNDDLVKANKGVNAAGEQRDELQEQLDELTKKSGDELKAKDAQIAVLTQQVKDAQDPAKLDAAINDRLAVFTVARRIMGDSYKSDSKSIVDVRKEVVNAKANLGDATKMWGDSEFKAAFEMLAAGASRSGGSGGGAGGITDARAAFSRPHFAVTDEREKAYADREKEDAEAWKTGGVQKTA